MAARAAERKKLLHLLEAGDIFARWRRPDDPEDIVPQILAARCLGISYGDLGPRLPPDVCAECWGDRYVWYGNTWGLRHVGDAHGRCAHACHDDEILLAGDLDPSGEAGERSDQSKSPPEGHNGP